MKVGPRGHLIGKKEVKHILRRFPCEAHTKRDDSCVSASELDGVTSCNMMPSALGLNGREEEDGGGGQHRYCGWKEDDNDDVNVAHISRHRD